jgi:hypothetical protein
MVGNTKIRFLCLISRVLDTYVCNAVTRILGRGRIRGKMARKTNEEFNKLNDAPEVTLEVSICACDKLVEIGFHRCKDDVIYIMFLCEECQKIRIKKYNLTLLDEMKYG